MAYDNNIKIVISVRDTIIISMPWWLTYICQQNRPKKFAYASAMCMFWAGVLVCGSLANATNSDWRDDIMIIFAICIKAIIGYRFGTRSRHATCAMTTKVCCVDCIFANTPVIIIILIRRIWYRIIIIIIIIFSLICTKLKCKEGKKTIYIILIIHYIVMRKCNILATTIFAPTQNSHFRIYFVIIMVMWYA